MTLQHKTSLVKFKYVGQFKPQFTNSTYVRLLNLKTGKEERFMADTYRQYFTILNQ